MTSVERILRVAKSDVKLQAIINNYFLGVGYAQTFVGGYGFKEKEGDSPAFCLGFHALNIPIGLVFVSEGLSNVLTQEELEFAVLHEIGHIMKNHFVGTSFIWLMKTWIVDIITDIFEVSKQNATKILEGLKLLYVIGSRKKTIEEEAKARLELEADNFAVTVQGRKDPAISLLRKLSKGNIRTPTHVTFDGSFPFPITTFEERIEAIKNLDLGYFGLRF